MPNLFVRALVTAALLLVAEVHAQTRPGSAAEQGDVTFRLAIPDRLKLRETSTTRKEIRWGDGSPEETTRTIAESEVVYRKSSGGGFTVAVRPRPVGNVETVPGSPQAALATSLSNLKLTYEFDQAGNLTSVRGLEKAMEELHSAIPAEMAPLMKMLTAPVLAQLADRWSSRFGFLVGKTFQVGVVRTGKAPIALVADTAPVEATVTIALKKREKRVGRDCVRFSMGYVVDDPKGFGETVSGMLRAGLGQMLASVPKEGVEAKKALSQMPDIQITRFEVATERIVDPSTMIVYEEEVVRSHRATTSDGTSATWREVTTLRYDEVP